MSSKTQSRLLGEPSGDSVSISTSGRVIRPALAAPASLVDECKPAFTKRGVHIRAVDSANVAMIRQQTYPEAFDHYTLDTFDDEVVVGLNLTGLNSKLSHARLGKRTDDPVDIDIDGSRTLVEIERDYDDTTVRYADEQLNLDPGSVREMPELPDLDTTASAEVDAGAFKDAIEHIDGATDHVEFRADDDSLLLTGGENDDSPSDYSSAAEFEGVATLDDDAVNPRSIYSLDYLTSFVKALKRAKVERITIEWGQEFPTKIHYSREIDGETAYEGTYMVAPRIADGDRP